MPFMLGLVQIRLVLETLRRKVLILLTLNMNNIFLFEIVMVDHLQVFLQVKHLTSVCLLYIWLYISREATNNSCPNVREGSINIYSNFVVSQNVSQVCVNTIRYV